MSEQTDLPDWLKAMRPQEPAPGEQADVPDWLQSMRPRDSAPAPVEEPAAEEPADEEPPEPEPQPSPTGMSTTFEVLRQKASTPAELEAEPSAGSPLLLIFRGLTPLQRFVLSLMLFMNVSTLGCLLLMIMGRISFVR